MFQLKLLNNLQQWNLKSPNLSTCVEYRIIERVQKKMLTFCSYSQESNAKNFKQI